MPSELRNRGRPADANTSDDASTATVDGWAPPKQPFVHHETSAFTRINSGTQTDLTMSDIAAMSAELGVRGVPTFGQPPYTADAHLTSTHPVHHTATLTSNQRTSSPVAPGQGDAQSAGSRSKTRRGVYCEDVGSVRAAGLLFLIVGSVWMWSAMNQTQPPIPGPIPPPSPPPSPPPTPLPTPLPTPPPPPPTQPSPPPTLPPKHSLVVSSNRDTIARMLTLSETHKRLTPNGTTDTLDSIYWSPAGDGRFTVVSSEDGWNATATEETLTVLLAKYTRIYIVEMVTQTRFSRSPFRNELHDGIRAAKPNSVNVTTVFWDTSCSVMATLMQKEYNWPRVDEAACHEDPDGEFTKFGTWAAVRKGGIDPSALTLVGVPRGTSIEEQARMVFEPSGITPQ